MPAPDMPPVVTLTETKQLYWFCHGSAITDGNVRQRLRRAWGFCPRHTWLLFCVEHELRYLYLRVPRPRPQRGPRLRPRPSAGSQRNPRPAVDGRQSTGVAASCLPTLRDSAAAHTAARPAMPIAPDRERHERATGRHSRSTRPAERAAIAQRQVHDRRRTASHARQRRGLSRSAGMVRWVAGRTPVPDDGMNRRLGAHRERRAGLSVHCETSLESVIGTHARGTSVHRSGGNDRVRVTVADR